jgi:hypothetical protein
MKSPLHNVNPEKRRFAKRAVVVALAFVAITSVDTRSQEPAPILSGPSFIPDGRASTLAGWHTLGQAAWRADQGEIVGNGTIGSGWLVLDRAFQDTGLYTAFECSGSCDTGVLLQLRPTSDGIKGTFLAIKDGDLKGYSLTLDRDGNQVEQNYNASTQYSMNDWVEHAYDFTGDGWPDVLTTSHAGGGKDGAVLYVNPKGESRRWDKYKVVPVIQSEETVMKDVDGDGKPELVYEAEGYMRYAKPDPANPTGTWTIHTVSEKGPWPAHGIGVGDINGDGRMDILGADGWWEQPPAGNGDQPWKYHPVAFGDWGRASPGGSEIGVYDVNGDGLNDVVTSLQAHGWGLAWFEQKRDKNGEITFVKHLVMDNYNTKNAGSVAFSELHGTAIADVDGDGIPDFIVGKRFWSHLDAYYDSDPYGPAVLYWYKTVRNPKTPGGGELVPRLIHNRSGAGSDVLAVDLNDDGRMDIVTSTRSGTYIFWGKPGKAH